MNSGVHQQVAVLFSGNQQCQRRLCKGGTTGFVKVINDKQLLIPDVAGTNHSMAGEISQIIRRRGCFFIPSLNQTVRVNGRIKVIERSELADVKLEVQNTDQTAKVL